MQSAYGILMHYYNFLIVSDLSEPSASNHYDLVDAGLFWSRLSLMTSTSFFYP